MNTPVILIHPGWMDSGPEHWQSLWLKKFPNAVKVEQCEWMRPVKQEWVETLNTYIEQHREREIVFVGHSLACPTFAHWVKEYRANSSATIRGALLVSPGDADAPSFPKEIQGFAPMPLDPLNTKTTIVVSSNDQYISVERAELFSNAWGATLINIGPNGHIGAEDGFGEWRTGEKLLQELL